MVFRLAEVIAGTDVAKAIQFGIEYDPEPPFDCGSLAKAPREIVALAGTALASEGATAAGLNGWED